MKGAIAILAKTPGLTPTKTRLAKDLGRQKTDEFYRLSLEAIEETLIEAQRQENVDIYWALAEENGKPDWSNFPHFWTGGGDFGQRLDQVYSKLIKEHDFVILIGTDSPQIKAEDISLAIQTLGDKNCVIGPSLDGGFYLFASKKEIKVWQELSYSQETTREDLEEKLRNEAFEVSHLPAKLDVDEIGDLELLKKALGKERSEKKRSLLDFVKKC